MDLPAFARIGESRRRRLVVWCCTAVVIASVAACGGGVGDSAAATPPGQPALPSGSVQPGELPSELLLAEPRTVVGTSQIALAWSSEGAFTGSIVAQVEQGPSFAPSAAFTLQSNGPAADFGAHQFRYADGFFLLTALTDNDVAQGQQPFGVDLYPPDVPRVPPVVPPCRGNDIEPCSNSLGFVDSFDWPKVAGDLVSVVIPRADPAMLSYRTLVKRSASSSFDDWPNILVGGQGAELSVLFPASAVDFPTARVKVRGCNMAGECVESAERSLEEALVKGVIELPQRDSTRAPSPADESTQERVVVEESLPGGESRLRIYGRREFFFSWSPLAQVTSALPGFGRRFSLSGDGLTLAVEVSPCAAVSVVCNDSAVIVYRSSSTTVNTYDEQARFIGVRAPQLNGGGDRMAAIAIAAQRGGDAILGFARTGVAWRQLPMPAIDYTPLDIALSDLGNTMAVARQGTHDDPSGGRAVVIYDGGFPEGAWHEVAVLRSNKRLDSVGSADDDGFGFVNGATRSLSMARDGSIVAVGASLDSSDASDTVGDPNNHNAPNSGAIYIFQRQPDNTFVKEAFLKARGAVPLDHFGHSAVLRGFTLFGGARGLAANAPGVNRNQAADQALPSPTPGPDGALTGAAAYVFERSGDTWVERATMVAPNAATADFNASHLVLGGGGGFADSGGVLDTGVPDGAGGMVRRAFAFP